MRHRCFGSSATVRRATEPTMELLTFLRRRWRRFRLLALVPLVAVAATTAATMQSPERYVADATLRMPSPDATYRAARVDAATAFVEAVDRDDVRRGAADQVGVGVAELTSSVSVRADGDVIVVSSSTERPGSTASGMVEATLAAGIAEVFAPARAEADAALAIAEGRADAADAALVAFEQERGQVGVLDRHRSLVASLGDLRAQRAVARAEDRPEEAKALTELIDEGERQVVELETLLPEYRRVSAALDRAEAQVTDAQRVVDDLAAAEQGAREEALRVTSAVSDISVSSQLAERLLAAAAVGLLLAAASLAVLEVVSPPRSAAPTVDGPRRLEHRAV